MKNQNTMTREACKKGILSGGILAGFAALFILYVSENREIPFLHQYVRGNDLPGIRAVGAILFIIGICVLVKNKRRLNELDRKGGKSGAGYRETEGNGRNQEKNGSSYAYYYCEHCGKKLRVSGGKGRIQVTCPVCGHKFIVNR